MLARHLAPVLRKAAAAYPVVTLTGPRQSGKTTLVRAVFADHLYVSLEAPDVRMRALEDPRSLLALSDRMVIDEILPTFESFVRLAAARTGQELNLSALANDIGVAQQTVRRWLNALRAGFLAITLPPHFASYRKRIRKRPRLHFMDTGLVCYLLGIRDAATLERHPLRGSVFESFVVAELVKHFAAVRGDAPLYHWRDATGHEIDVLIDSGDRLIPVEVKSARTVPATACDTIGWWTSLPGNPNRGGVLVHGGDQAFDFRGVRVLPWYFG